MDWKRVAFVGAAAVAAAAALVPALQARTATTPKCATSGLVIWLNTQGDGAAGSSYYQLEFTNLSGHTCTLSGYAGVSAVNLQGHQIGSAAGRDTGTSAHSVSLANGKSRSATLQITVAGNFPSSTCHQATAAGLRVYPPNQKASKVVPFPFAACSHAGPVFLHTRPVS